MDVISRLPDCPFDIAQMWVCQRPDCGSSRNLPRVVHASPPGEDWGLGPRQGSASTKLWCSDLASSEVHDLLLTVPSNHQWSTFLHRTGRVAVTWIWNCSWLGFSRMTVFCGSSRPLSQLVGAAHRPRSASCRCSWTKLMALTWRKAFFKPSSQNLHRYVGVREHIKC